MYEYVGYKLLEGRPAEGRKKVVQMRCSRKYFGLFERLIKYKFPASINGAKK